MMFKEINTEKKNEVIHLFRTTRDNEIRNIAKITKLKEHFVNKIINEWLSSKKLFV